MSANPVVYFIDDSATMREVIKIAFRRENINVIACHDAGSAIGLMDETAPDVVISDVIMPEKDGYEVCQYIKQHPKMGQTPVILMSGVVNRSVAEKAFAVKADELIRKPFQPQDLIGRVRHLLYGKPPRAGIFPGRPDSGANGCGGLEHYLPDADRRPPIGKARARRHSGQRRTGAQCADMWLNHGCSPFRPLREPRVLPSRACRVRHCRQWMPPSCELKSCGCRARSRSSKRNCAPNASTPAPWKNTSRPCKKRNDFSMSPEEYPPEWSLVSVSKLGCHGDRSAERLWPEQPKSRTPTLIFEEQKAVRTRSGATFCFPTVETKGGSTSTSAVNGCVPLVSTLAVVGVMPTLTGGAAARPKP